MREWEWIETMPDFKAYGRLGEVRVRYLTHAQAEALLANFPEHQREAVLFALSTGLSVKHLAPYADQPIMPDTPAILAKPLEAQDKPGHKLGHGGSRPRLRPVVIN